jgi:hypothetical protein
MTTKRCPMCHDVIMSDERECSCGYEFGQDIDKVLKLLNAQLMGAWIVFGIVIALDLMAVGGTIYLVHYHGIIVYSLFVFVALMLWTARAARTILITRESMRQLKKRRLPKATLRNE